MQHWPISSRYISANIGSNRYGGFFSLNHISKGAKLIYQPYWQYLEPWQFAVCELAVCLLMLSTCGCEHVSAQDDYHTKRPIFAHPPLDSIVYLHLVHACACVSVCVWLPAQDVSYISEETPTPHPPLDLTVYLHHVCIGYQYRTIPTLIRKHHVPT